MRITLACPSKWYDEDWGDVDETVDVPDGRAVQLVRDGLARMPESVSSLSGAEVDQAAAVEGVDLSGAHTVAEKKDALKRARASKEG